MKGKTTIRFKAALLLTVFGLNTIIGFACSLGLDMGFNKPQHGKITEEGTVHIHKDGKRHIHKKEASNATHHHTNKPTASKKDDCCKEKIVKLQRGDKSAQYSKTTVQVPVYVLPKDDTRIAPVQPVDPFLQTDVPRHFHPPPRDIRIAIQSFQI